jgi:hypothetical protein
MDPRPEPETDGPNSAAERARLEEEDERREAERAAQLAAQRAVPGQSSEDPYVARRVRAEMALRVEMDRQAIADEEQAAGTSRESPWGLYLAIGVVIGGLLLALITYMNRHPPRHAPAPAAGTVAPRP